MDEKELRDILAQEFSAQSEPQYADLAFGGNSDSIVRAALAAMRRVCVPASSEPTEKAVVIPIENCRLAVNVGRDGTWLHFLSSDGVTASLNINILADRQSGIIGRGLKLWCEDRQKQAAKD